LWVKVQKSFVYSVEADERIRNPEKRSVADISQKRIVTASFLQNYNYKFYRYFGGVILPER